MAAASHAAAFLPPEGAAPDAIGGNFWRDDPALAELLSLRIDRTLLAHLEPHFDRLGQLAGGELDHLARAMDASPPALRPRDRFGNDDFRIDHHPAHARMLGLLMGEFGLHAMSHRSGCLDWHEPLPATASSAFLYLAATAGLGALSAISTTDTLARVLRCFATPAQVQAWQPRLTSRRPHDWSTGAVFMAERGAGSDVGAITTTASQCDGQWRLSGEKWFCCNADCDVALVPARLPAPRKATELGLFLLPRRLPDGSPNRWRIIRLKQQLGGRGIACGEAILDGAIAELIGEPSQGAAAILEMVRASRRSLGVQAAGLMRRALIEARAAARGRKAFGRAVIDFPAQRHELLELQLLTEQALSFALWTATLVEAADGGDSGAAQLLRLATPLLSFRACQDAREVAAKAMDIRGGNGYVEEFVEPRLLRDAHGGPTAAGSANILAEDAIGRSVGDERAAEPFAEALVGLLAEAPLAAAAPVAEAMRRAAAFAEDVVMEPLLHRQAASALYRAATACLFVAEGTAIATVRGDARRMLLARLVLDQQLSARDPMARGQVTTGTAIADAILGGDPMPVSAVLRLL